MRTSSNGRLVRRDPGRSMLTRIVEFSVRRPGLVIGLACALLIYGIVVASRTRYDVFPEFAPPQVEIQTEAPGLDPEQVEQRDMELLGHPVQPVDDRLGQPGRPEGIERGRHAGTDAEEACG